MTCKYKVKIKDIQYNYKVQMTDIQSKYKFKVFCTGGNKELEEKVNTLYEAWPRVSGEGETITLNDTINTTMAIDLKGNTSQEGTPTPESPQDIHVVSGDNTIKIEGKNLASDRYEDYVMNDTAYAVLPIKLEQGATYIISATRVGAIKTSYYNYGIVRDGDRYSNFVGLSTIVEFASGDAKPAMSITIDSSWVNPKLVCYLGNRNPQGVFNELFSNFHIQFEKSNVKTDYVPYERTDYEIDLGIENLFDKNNANILSASLSGSGLNPSAKAKTLYISINGGETYTIQKIKSARFRIATSITTPTTSLTTIENFANIDSSSKYTLTTSSSAKYLLLYYYYSDDETLTEQQILNSIQIEKGSKANSYTPYGTTPIELCKIGDYQDYFYKDSSKWYKYNAIGKIVLNGSENFGTLTVQTSTGNNDMVYVYTTLLDSVLGGTIGYCDKFINNLTDLTISTNSTNEMFSVSKNWGGLRLYFDKTRLSAVSNQAFKDWLSNNTPNIYYILKTPTTTEITDATLISQLEALKEAESYSGQTNISQVNNDKPFIITAKALKDLSNL